MYPYSLTQLSLQMTISGVPFQVPEEFFQGIAPPPFSLPDFDPRPLRHQKDLIASPKSAQIIASCKEIVVLAGSPAAGKSTFAKVRLLYRGKLTKAVEKKISLYSCVKFTDHRQIRKLIRPKVNYYPFPSQNYLIPRSYTHVNRDTLGSWQKCIQVAKDALKEGKSVVVDNTNADVPTRQRYVNLAKENNVQVLLPRIGVRFESVSGNWNRY